MEILAFLLVHTQVFLCAKNKEGKDTGPASRSHQVCRNSGDAVTIKVSRDTARDQRVAEAVPEEGTPADDGVRVDQVKVGR